MFFGLGLGVGPGLTIEYKPECFFACPSVDRSIETNVMILGLEESRKEGDGRLLKGNRGKEGDFVAYV